MQLPIIGGSTGNSIDVFIQDSTSTTGAGKSGLAYNTSGLICYYTFTGAFAGSVSVSLVTLATVTTAWASGGFIEIDATHMPGWYRFDIPNLAVAGGSGPEVNFHFQGATGMAPCPVKLAIGMATPTSAQNATAVWQDATSGDFTVSGSIGKSLFTSGAVPGAAGGLFIAGTNAATSAASGSHWIGTVDTITIYTGDTPQTGDSFARLGAPAGVSVSADIAAIKSDTGTILTDVNTGAGAIYSRLGAPAGASMSADIASVKTSVGSVTGAVGSVTGNVGGSVGSLTLSQVLGSPRALDSIADGSLQLNDALWSAIGAGVGKKDASGGTSYIVSTPSTGTVLRTYALTLISPPATIPDKAV